MVMRPLAEMVPVSLPEGSVACDSVIWPELTVMLPAPKATLGDFM